MINTVTIDKFQVVINYVIFNLQEVKLYNPKKANKKLTVFITLAAVESSWKYKSSGVERKIKNKIKIYEIALIKTNANNCLFHLIQKTIKKKAKEYKNFSFKSKK